MPFETGIKRFREKCEIFFGFSHKGVGNQME